MTENKLCMNCKYFGDCVLCEKGIQIACELFEISKSENNDCGDCKE